MHGEQSEEQFLPRAEPGAVGLEGLPLGFCAEWGFHAMFQREQSLKPFLMCTECSQVSWCHQQSTAPNLCLEKSREAKGILLWWLKGDIFPM